MIRPSFALVDERQESSGGRENEQIPKRFRAVPSQDKSAQKKVTDALLDGLRPDESEGRETQRPCKNVTPPKTNQPRR